MKLTFYKMKTYGIGLMKVFNFRNQLGQSKTFLLSNLLIYIFLQYILNQISTQIAKGLKL